MGRHGAHRVVPHVIYIYNHGMYHEAYRGIPHGLYHRNVNPMDPPRIAP